MGLFKDDTGKTEKPTPTRLSEAGNKGNVPLSREFVTAGTLLIMTIILMSTGHWLTDALKRCLEFGLQVDPEKHPIMGMAPPSEGGQIDLVFAQQQFLLSYGGILWPFLWIVGIALIATMLTGYGQIGFKLRTEALKVRIEKLNPVNNLNRLFSFSSVFRTIVSALKLAVLGGVLYTVLQGRMPIFAQMYENESFAESVAMIVDTAFLILIWIAVIVLLISLADLAWQRFDYIKNNMMTKHEVEDERKRSEGDPAVKARLRSAALQIMRQRMMESIPKADVIITNPTHFSVALRYDRTKDPAPRVVAKGLDDLAMKIREIAKENDVPLMEDPPLARALYRAVKVDQEIPEKFYKAVATVLSHVFRLKEQVA
ncbi:MAG: flagellar biosynthesis protein FlhB [Planctomycetota bacterium]|jgi:flagellar biosynthetic protein FlhB